MSILDIFKAISDYGITLILAGLLIYILIKLVNLGFNYLTKKLNVRKHDKLLEMRAEIDVDVHELINEFITAHRGTRVQVVEFTNSVTSVAYLPFKYMSCTYEVISYGSKPEAKRIDKLSTSLFSPLLVKLSKEGVVSIDNNKAWDLSGAVHDIFEGMGSKYQLLSILRSQKTKSIGFVALCKEDEITQYDISGIETLSAKLSALLGVLDK